MIKELSLAVIFGLLIGFGLTGTFYFVKQNKNNKNTPNIIAPSPAPDSQTNTSLTPTIILATSSFEITSPQNNDIISTSKTTLKGTATPDSLIIITTPLKNYHLSANAQGNFSQVIDLEPGYNAINLTALDQNDQESHLEIFLTYSTTKLE
jgi:hypothetical protein